MKRTPMAAAHSSPSSPPSSHGAPMMDALAKLELTVSMRPQSVPSWLNSDTNHAPKVTALGPRRSAVESIVDATTVSSSSASSASSSTIKSSSPPVSLATIAERERESASGPSASSVRPRAPIALLQKESMGSNSEHKSFLSQESELVAPKRSRHRTRLLQQQQQQPSNGQSTTTTTTATTTSRRVKQSLSESLRSLEFFDKTNRSRELSAKYSVLRTQADPEGNVHFVNIDADEEDGEEEEEEEGELLEESGGSGGVHHDKRKEEDDDSAVAVDHGSVSPNFTSLHATSKPKASTVSSSSSSVDKPRSTTKSSSSSSLKKPSTTSTDSSTTTTTSDTSTTDVFRIPELPRGKHLVINILSTWGDPFYVGLMGLELFDHTGHAVHLSDVDKQLSADPPDLNVHVDHHDRVDLDPRTIDKLMDGHYFTCDELHAWLAPFTRGQNHFIYVDLDYALSLSMIRIWNYNTTRIHAYRGARYVEISLDGKCIFKGEIRRAPGSVAAADRDMEACHECILFTTNASILQLIEKYEKATHCTLTSANKTTTGDHGLSASELLSDEFTMAAAVLQRPKTGNRATMRSGGATSSTSSTGSGPVVFPLSSVPKPGKAHALSLTSTHQHHHQSSVASGAPGAHNSSGGGASRPCTAPIVCDHLSVSEKPVVCQRLALLFEANWGDPYDVGLAGIQFLDHNYAPLKVSVTDVARVSAPFSQPKAQRLVATHGARHLSTNGDEMWSAPLHSVLTPAVDESGWFCVEFEQPVTLRALKIWNYNTTLEESFKGAKQIGVVVDGVRLGSFSLRKAPGNVMDFDFGQFLYLKSHLHTGSTGTSTPSSTTTGTTAEVLAVHSPFKPDALRSGEDAGSRGRWHGTPGSLPEVPEVPVVVPAAALSPLAPHRHDQPPMKPIAELLQQYQTPLFPTGYIVKFVFLSTWGDTFYVGLNGLELFDQHNNHVELRDHMIDAQPRDINILKDPGAPHDVRTLDKLIDGVNETYDDRHMWLAPFTPSQHNKLVLFFNEPVTLSRIRLWNYSKTPTRGVREFEIFLDDVLIFHGQLRQSPPLRLTSEDDHEYELMGLTSDVAENRRLRKRRYDRAEAAAKTAHMTQSVLFTDDADVLESEAPFVYLPDEELEESVTFYDNSQVLSLSDTPQRDSMAVVRPTTSAGGVGVGLGGTGAIARSSLYR